MDYKVGVVLSILKMSKYYLFGIGLSNAKNSTVLLFWDYIYTWYFTCKCAENQNLGSISSSN